jgi:hypothetical protein
MIVVRRNIALQIIVSIFFYCKIKKQKVRNSKLTKKFHEHLDIYVYIYIHINTYIYIYMYMYINKQICIYIY